MGLKPRIFVNDSLPSQARDILKEYDVAEVQADDEFLSECAVLMGWPGRVKPELLLKMRRLRMFQSLSAGVDYLPFQSLPEGARVYSNAGGYTDAVAEHAWGILLGVAKGIHVRNTRVVPRKLRDGTLVVVGCGNIGSEVARISKSLEMRTVGVSRSFKSPEMFDERHGIEELGTVIPQAEAVVIALPLTSVTKGVVNYEVLARAKESVVVANVGRGETVDQPGLIRWLKERPESRYATDVFWESEGRETFRTEAWDLPNFAGTLHISGLPLGEALLGPKTLAAINVRRFLETGDALNLVDPDEYKGLG